MMLSDMDRTWMLLPDRFCRAYVDGVDSFIEFAKVHLGEEVEIKCPCTSCRNYFKKDYDTVKSHLLIRGMMVSYTTWLLHGELSQPDEEDDSEDEYNEDGGDEYEQLIEDHYKGTYMGSDTVEREAVRDFENLVEAAQCGLYPGCKKSNTLLAFVIEMLQVKVESGWSNHSFNKFLLKMRKFYPEGNVIPESINECKNLLRDLGLGYEVIHACPNDCVLFWKENAHLEKCPNPKCQSSRYKVNDSKGRKIPQKILRYFPLTPRLKRLYMTSEIAKDMRWHSDNVWIMKIWSIQLTPRSGRYLITEILSFPRRPAMLDLE